MLGDHGSEHKGNSSSKSVNVCGVCCRVIVAPGAQSTGVRVAARTWRCVMSVVPCSSLETPNSASMNTSWGSSTWATHAFAPTYSTVTR